MKKVQNEINRNLINELEKNGSDMQKTHNIRIWYQQLTSLQSGQT
jgi:hypothetical protein